MIPAGIPITVNKDIMMQSGAKNKKNRPIPKLFQMEPEMVETMPIRLTQVETLGYDPAHVRLPSNSFGVSASLP